MKKLVLLALALAGCVDHKAPLTGTASIRVEVVAPADLGSFATRIPDSARHVVVNLTALDEEGNEDPSFDADVQGYVQYLGTLTPYLGQASKIKTHLTAGKATNVAIDLDPVFGPTTLWFDDGDDPDATYATGASPPLWFRDPNIADIQTPANEMALNALSDSPLENKNIDVDSSRYGADGLLVVTSVFAQGYTVSDMNCPGGHAPCTTNPYDSLLVFSFSAPTYSNGADQQDTTPNVLEEGQIMARFNGGVEEFNGLTEIGFPQNFPLQPVKVDKSLEPTPVKIEAGRAGETHNWFGPLSDPNGEINFERYEAAPVELDNGTVCPLDDDYATYKQWKIDPGDGTGCSGHNIVNIITSGVIADLDPATLVGKKLPRLVGILRPVSIGSFNVWIIYPRSSADLTLPQ